MADTHISPDVPDGAARALALAVARDAVLRDALGIDGPVFDADGVRIDAPPADAAAPPNTAD